MVILAAWGFLGLCFGVSGLIHFGYHQREYERIEAAARGKEKREYEEKYQCCKLDGSQYLDKDTSLVAYELFLRLLLFPLYPIWIFVHISRSPVTLGRYLKARKDLPSLPPPARTLEGDDQ